MQETVEWIDWQVESDLENIREGAIDLQSAVHERMYAPQFETKEAAQKCLDGMSTRWRRKLLDKLPIYLNKPLAGRALEIGAGTGWCSALLSKMPDITSVDCMDYDPYCVQTLMPNVFSSLNADTSKIRRIRGSYNQMPEEGAYDLVLSMGALHHSENLQRTLEECFKVMKPGAVLMATEPVEGNALTLKAEKAKGDKADPHAKKKYGRVTQHKDNSDHYVRMCEYEVAAMKSGFDCTSIAFDAWLTSGGCFALLKRMLVSFFIRDRIFCKPKPYSGLQRNVYYPYFAKFAYVHLAGLKPNPGYDRLCLILSKPMES